MSDKIKMYVKQTIQGVVELDPENYPKGSSAGEMMEIERGLMKASADYFDHVEDANESIQMSFNEAFFEDKIDWREFAMKHGLTPQTFTQEIFACAATLGINNIESDGHDKPFWGLKFQFGEKVVGVVVEELAESGDKAETPSEG